MSFRSVSPSMLRPVSPAHKKSLQGTESSSSGLIDNRVDATQCSGFQNEFKIYSKLLKARDKKINLVNDKLRRAEKQLTSYRMATSKMEYELEFFKQKMEEEFYGQLCADSEVNVIAGVLKGIVLKMTKVFEQDHGTMSALARHLEDTQRDESSSQLETTKKLMETLEYQIHELTNNFNIIHKNSDVMTKSTDLRLEEYRKVDEMEKEALRKHIHELIDFYEPKVIDSQVFTKELTQMHSQRDHTMDLLRVCQKERNEWVNEMYELAKIEYKVDFNKMSRAEIVKFALQLVSYIKDLKQDRDKAQHRLKKIETVEKDKYDEMLTKVRKIQNNADVKNRPLLRRQFTLQT